MPVEIRELIIRAYVDEAQAPAAEKAPSPPVDREELVAECVEQVMEILKRARER